MNLKFGILFILFFVFHVSSAQRFEEPIFDKINKTTLTYRDSFDLDLYLAADDTFDQKPLVIYVHGGGFSGGRRDEQRYEIFCTKLATYGYAVASISYPLLRRGKGFGCDVSAEDKMNTIEIVGQYINSASHFLRQHSAAYHIDIDNIVLVGSSAGAEGILHAAYMPSCARPNNRIKYAGLISMAGALADINWLTAETTIPMQLFHGTCDGLVPYGSAPHHYCAESKPGYLLLHGGGALAEKAKLLNQGFYLFTECGGGHEWHSKPFTYSFDLIIDFLYHDVILGEKRQIHIIEENLNSCDLFPVPTICKE